MRHAHPDRPEPANHLRPNGIERASSTPDPGAASRCRRAKIRQSTAKSPWPSSRDNEDEPDAEEGAARAGWALGSEIGRHIPYIQISHSRPTIYGLGRASTTRDSGGASTRRRAKIRRSAAKSPRPSRRDNDNEVDGEDGAARAEWTLIYGLERGSAARDSGAASRFRRAKIRRSAAKSRCASSRDNDNGAAGAGGKRPP